MTNPGLNDTYLQMQAYRKYQTENSNPRKLAASTKIHVIDNLTATNLKEEKDTNTTTTTNIP